MRSIARAIVLAAITSPSMATLAFAQQQQAQSPEDAEIKAQVTHNIGDVTPYLIADRAEEVALARTAAPRSISDSATVLVLTRTGYVTAVKGTNGFTCFVARSFAGDVHDAGLWDPQSLAPHCLNAPATRSVLPAMLANAQWTLQGAMPLDVVARTAKAYASGEFAQPEKGSMAYMLSPRQTLTEKNLHWLPHVMFYFDRSVNATTWGAGLDGTPFIDANATDPDVPITTLLVPVRRWSDGTPAPAPTGASH